MFLACALLRPCGPAYARQSSSSDALPFTWDGQILDWAQAVGVLHRMKFVPAGAARAFHLGLARGTAQAVRDLQARIGARRVALSGGVWQKALLRDLLTEELGGEVLVNRAGPVNDGGISLGQTALAAYSTD